MIPVIPWHSHSTQASWQASLDHFGYVAVELSWPVEIPYYFRREGWDAILKIIGKSSLEELLAQRSFEGIHEPYPIDSGNFYRVMSE